MKAPETAAPLDFFSWHIYTDDPAAVLRHARYCREKLDAAGLRKPKSHKKRPLWGLADFFELG